MKHVISLLIFFCISFAAHSQFYLGKTADEVAADCKCYCKTGYDSDGNKKMWWINDTGKHLVLFNGYYSSTCYIEPLSYDDITMWTKILNNGGYTQTDTYTWLKNVDGKYIHVSIFWSSESKSYVLAAAYQP